MNQPAITHPYFNWWTFGLFQMLLIQLMVISILYRPKLCVRISILNAFGYILGNTIAGSNVNINVGLSQLIPNYCPQRLLCLSTSNVWKYQLLHSYSNYFITFIIIIINLVGIKYFFLKVLSVTVFPIPEFIQYPFFFCNFPLLIFLICWRSHSPILIL